MEINGEYRWANTGPWANTNETEYELSFPYMEFPTFGRRIQFLFTAPHLHKRPNII